ncbi:conserved hypothetical protein [Thermotoga petrophila RKU-10]|uniref:Uncharacterized protein n=1 Tax=Thermotoga petrophila (strain ATCC BAA-489 / DSM 13996 / JCM 10882 / RKU-10) TaxID=590168 RepID=D2C717_THEP2|nr:hypothetical protein [Thermotoga petrophila]ADA66753.1 conserved hypothetical protein [Thermotoga petrophila RKU-10]
MFTKAVLSIFSWALVLELIVLFYYLWRSLRPVEFYLNLGLLGLTVPFLVFLVVREKKKRREEDDGKDR